MPLSLFQIPVREKVVQVSFHPRNETLFILNREGELRCFSLKGDEIWRLPLPFEPMDFRINAEGTLMAILGNGVLCFADLQSQATAQVEVGELTRLLDWYRNCVLIGGYHQTVEMLKPTGEHLRKLTFESPLYRFKVIPATENLILYHQNRELVCADIWGKRLWKLEDITIRGDVVTSETNPKAYFIMDAHDLIQFDMSGESFYEVGEELAVRSFELSSDGKTLLVLDTNNVIHFFGENMNERWTMPLQTDITVMKVSGNGSRFLTLEEDGILSCYTLGESDGDRVDFFEMGAAERRVDWQEPTWTVKPGAHYPVRRLSNLTVNRGGNGVGLLGLDGALHFFDEAGRLRHTRSFPGMVKSFEISPDFNYGHLVGDRDITIFHLREKREKFLSFEKPYRGEPFVNYAQGICCVLSRERELLGCTFEGTPGFTAPLERDYTAGMVCDEFGLVLYDDKELAGLTGEGKTRFRFPLPARIRSLHFADRTLVGLTENSTLFSLNLSRLKGKKRQWPGKGRRLRVVSVNPLLVLDSEEKRVYQLDGDLRTVTDYPVESDGTHCFMGAQGFLEIMKHRDRLYCHDGEGRLVWRHEAELDITDSALMRGGLVYITADSLCYLALSRQKIQAQDLAHFLEI